MPEEKDIRTMIDEDIDRVERVWEASSYDSDALEELFRLLLEHYAERIEGFTKRLKVIQPYEDIADMAGERADITGADEAVSGKWIQQRRLNRIFHCQGARGAEF